MRELRKLWRIKFCCILVSELVNGKDEPAESYNEFAELFRYDYNYDYIGKNYFKIFTIPAHWDDALRICRLEGADLAAPINEYTLNAMKWSVDYIQQTRENLTVYIHTGFSSKFLSGLYMSVTGVRLHSVPYNWGEGEPNNDREHKNSLIMNAAGELFIANFHERYPFVCYYTSVLGVDLIMNKCGVSDKEYKYIRLKKCYKYIKWDLSWKYAVDNCFAAGGHLLVINNKPEAKYLKSIRKRNNVDQKENLYSGFRFNSTTGEWLTVFEESLEDAGYSDWSAGQPDSKAESVCGDLFASMRLDDEDCTKPHKYICEMRTGAPERFRVVNEDWSVVEPEVPPGNNNATRSNQKRDLL